MTQNFHTYLNERSGQNGHWGECYMFQAIVGLRLHQSQLKTCEHSISWLEHCNIRSIRRTGEQSEILADD